MIALFLLACQSAPEMPKGPQADVGALAAENLCKLYAGAGRKCTADGNRVMAEGEAIEIVAQYTAYEERLGVATFKGMVRMNTSKGVWVTRMSGYGSGKQAALDRGLHEWALVSGTAFVDALHHDAERQALRAVQPTIGHGIFFASQTAVFPGWTLQRPPLEGGIDHDKMIAGFGPILPKMGPPPHVVRIEAANNLGELERTCFVDGAPAPDVCAAVADYPWPQIGGYEVRQSYAVYGEPIPEPPPSQEEEPAVEGD